MSDESELTAAEFLSQLKGRTGQAPSHDSSSSASFEELDLDFSDLSETAHDSKENTSSKAQRDTAPTDSEDCDESDLISGGSEQNSHLAELLDRVNSLLSDEDVDPNEPFRPAVPQSLEQTGLTFEEVERLVLKYLFARGSATGRQVCIQICLPFRIVESVLKQLKREQLIALKGAAAASDYEFVITDTGRDRARGYTQECTYFGAAPVVLRDYLKAMASQSIAAHNATEEDLKAAFSDLILSQDLLDRLGPAVNSGRGLFLFGEPGNGKTSIAERITRAFSSTIWIPRTLGIDGDIIRIFDPGIHEVAEEATRDGLFDLSGVDPRWVRIVRPTVVAGGELTMSELEVTQNLQTKICEAPLQLKSNCGTLVIDDFGRQRMPVEELLNRWIVPLEKRYDFLNLPSGKKIQVPFDQLIIFSTNLEPKSLVDGAFLRRIPYKIHVEDPSEDEFHRLFELMAPNMGFEYDNSAITHLIEKHYRAVPRGFRACHPRDLLAQVKNYCNYKGLPKKLTPEYLDLAVENYFSVM